MSIKVNQGHIGESYRYPNDPQSSPNGSVSKPCTPVVHIKIAGKWMFIPLKMILIGIDPYPNIFCSFHFFQLCHCARFFHVRDLQSILSRFEACVCLMIAFARSDWPQLARDAQRRAEVEQLQVDEVDEVDANVANVAANEVNLEVTS